MHIRKTLMVHDHHAAAHEGLHTHVHVTHIASCLYCLSEHVLYVMSDIFVGPHQASKSTFRLHSTTAGCTHHSEDTFCTHAAVVAARRLIALALLAKPACTTLQYIIGSISMPGTIGTQRQNEVQIRRCSDGSVKHCQGWL